MAKYSLRIVFGLSLAVFIVAGPIPKEFQEVAPEIRQVCLEQSGVSVDSVERAAQGEFSEDDKLKCYLKCGLAQFGLISRKGELQWNVLVRLAPPPLIQLAKNVSEKCAHITGTPGDLCDIAYNGVKCAYEAAPETFFIM